MGDSDGVLECQQASAQPGETADVPRSAQEVRPVLLNEWLKVLSYDGGSQQGRPQYDIKNVLTPVADTYHSSASADRGGGAKSTLVLECSEDFTLTHVFVMGPTGPRCTEPIRSGIVWLSDELPEASLARRLDSLSPEELRERVARCHAPAGECHGNATGQGSGASAADDEAIGNPCAYFSTDSKSREAEYELPRWREGRYALVRLLDTHGEQDHVQVSIMAFVGYLGRRADQQKAPLGPWMRRSVRQVWVNPSPLKSMFSSGGWVCDGRDFTGGCRSGQTDFRQTTVYTVTFRCLASGFDLCEKCAHDPMLGRVTDASIQADLDAFREPALCKLACKRLSNVLKRDWLSALPRYFAKGLLDTLVDALSRSLEAAAQPEEERSSTSSPRPEIAVGMRVEARYMLNSGRVTNTWYAGRVTGKNEDGTFRIDYDDGDKWYDAPADLIRSWEAARGQAGPEQRKVFRAAERAQERAALVQLFSELAQQLFGRGDLSVGDPVWALRPGEDQWEEGRLLELPSNEAVPNIVSSAENSSATSSEAGITASCLIAYRDGRPHCRVRARDVWKVTSGRSVMTAITGLFTEVCRGSKADTAKVAKLVQKGVDPTALNAEGSSTLLEAVKRGSPAEVFNALFERGACPDAPGRDGVTPLLQALLLQSDVVSDGMMPPPKGLGEKEIADLLRGLGATQPEDLRPQDRLRQLKDAFGRRILRVLLKLQPPASQPLEILEVLRLLLREMPLPLVKEALDAEALRALAALLQHFVGRAALLHQASGSDSVSIVLVGCRIFRAVLSQPDPQLQYLAHSHGALRWAQRIVASMELQAEKRSAAQAVSSIGGGLPLGAPPTLLSSLPGGPLSGLLSAGGGQLPRPPQHERLGPDDLLREARALVEDLHASASQIAAARQTQAGEGMDTSEGPDAFICNERLGGIVDALAKCSDAMEWTTPAKQALLSCRDLLESADKGEPPEVCSAYELERSNFPGHLLRFLRGGAAVRSKLSAGSGDLGRLAPVDAERWSFFQEFFGKESKQALARLVQALHRVIETGESFPVWHQHHKKGKGLKALSDPIPLKLRHLDLPGRVSPALPQALRSQITLLVEPLVSVRDLQSYLLRVMPVVNEHYLTYCHEVVGGTIREKSSGEDFVVIGFEVLHGDLPLPIHMIQCVTSGETHRVLLAMREHVLVRPSPSPVNLVDFRVCLCQLHTVGGSEAYPALLENLQRVVCAELDASSPADATAALPAVPVGFAGRDELQQAAKRAVRAAAGSIEEALSVLDQERSRVAASKASANTRENSGAAGGREVTAHPTMRVHTVMIAISEDVPFDLFWPMVREDIMGAVYEICPHGLRNTEEAVQAGAVESGMGPIAERLTLEEAEMLAARVGHIVQTSVVVDAAAVKELQNEKAKSTPNDTIAIASRVQFTPAAGEQWSPGVVIGHRSSSPQANSANKLYDIVDDQGVLWERLPRNRVKASAARKEGAAGRSSQEPSRRDSLFSELIRIREHLRRRQEQDDEEDSLHMDPSDASESYSEAASQAPPQAPQLASQAGVQSQPGQPAGRQPAPPSPCLLFATEAPTESQSEAAPPPRAQQAASQATPSGQGPANRPVPQGPPVPQIPQSLREHMRMVSTPPCEPDAPGENDNGPSIEEELRVLERLRSLERILPEDLLSGPMANLRIRRGNGDDGRIEAAGQSRRVVIAPRTHERGGNHGADVMRAGLPAFVRAAEMSNPTLSLDHPVVERLGAADLNEEDERIGSQQTESGDSSVQPPRLCVQLCLYPPGEAKSTEASVASQCGTSAAEETPRLLPSPVALPATWNLLKSMQYLHEQQSTQQHANASGSGQATPAPGVLPSPQKAPLDNWSLGFIFEVNDVPGRGAPSAKQGSLPTAQLADTPMPSTAASTTDSAATAASAASAAPASSPCAAMEVDSAADHASQKEDSPASRRRNSSSPAKKRRRMLHLDVADVAREMYSSLTSELQLRGEPAKAEVCLHEHLARCSNNACVSDAIELLCLLNACCLDLISGGTPWMSDKLNKKLQEQLEDPLHVVSGTLPCWASALPRLCPFLFSADARKKLLKYTAFGPSFAVHWTQESKLGQFLHRRAMVQTELNEQTNPRKMQELSQELSNIEEHVVKSNFWLGTLQSTLLRVQKGDGLLRQSELAMNIVSSSGHMVEVQFDGETGFGSAVTQSFYVEVSLALQDRERNRQVPLWVEDDNSTSSQYLLCGKGLLVRPLTEGPMREEAVRRFRFLGRLLGQALREGFIVPLPLAEEFFALVLGQPVGPSSFPRPGSGLAGELCGLLADYAAQLAAEEAEQKPGNPGKWRQEQSERTDFGQRFLGQERADVALQQSMSFKDYLALVGASFVETGLSGAPLCPGGEDMPVTADNVGEFVNLASQFWFGSGVSAQIEAFKSGLNEVFPFDCLLAFAPSELRNMFCGEDKIEWDEKQLMSHLRPVGGLTEKSPVFKYLIAILLEMEQSVRARFLDFVSSCPRLPPGGIANFHLDVFPDPSSNKHGFPRSRACANQLYLPAYSSKEELYSKLHEAVYSSAGHHEQRMRDL